MLSPNTLLQNRYLVLRQLGEGGQGAVYEAHDQRLNLRVALKQTFYDDEQSRTAFEREAQLLARLKHDALPNVIDHFFEGNGQFLVMEFVRGDDLGELINRQGRAFPAIDALDWGDQVLAVLEYLHRQNPPIIHRDIKPHNLKLNERGRVMLLDFGLAKATNTTVIRGYSRHYSPLEQTRGRNTDVRCDLYAVAATLYHLLTGQPPPEAETRDEAITTGGRDPLAPADALNPHLSPAVSDVLAQALQLDRYRRPPDASTMRQALEQARNRPVTHNPSVAAVIDQAPAKTEAPLPATVKDTSRATERSNAPTELDSAVGTQVEPQPAPEPRTPLLAFAGVALLVILGLAYWLWPRAQGGGDGNSTAVARTGAGESNATGRFEAMSYYLQLIPEKGKPSFVSVAAGLAPGDGFKFHFVPPRSGYLYIVGPDNKNQLSTLLTSQPFPPAGVKTNLIDARERFVFPAKDEALLSIAKDQSVASYTVIFHVRPLDSPAFLRGEAAHTLTAEEQGQLAAFRRQYDSFTSQLKPQPNGGATVITAPANSDASVPVIFDIEIPRREHN